MNNSRHVVIPQQQRPEDAPDAEMHPLLAALAMVVTLGLLALGISAIDLAMH